MASILFERDGFYVRNEFVLKTVVLTDFDKETVSIPFASPCQYRSQSLSKEDWRSVDCERQTKGLKWETGGLSQSEIKETLVQRLRDAACILVHGKKTTKWLQDLLGPEYCIKNLEDDFGCPTLDELGPNTGKAAKNLQLLKTWILNQSPELQDNILGDVNGNGKMTDSQDCFHSSYKGAHGDERWP